MMNMILKKTPQKLLSFMCIVFMLFTLLPTNYSHASGSEIKISLENVKGNKGDVVKVPVKLEQFSGNVATFQIPVQYDTTKLKFQRIYYKQGLKEVFYNQIGNEIKVVFLSSTAKGLTYEQLINTNQTLFELEFQILQTASDVASVSIMDQSVVDSSFNMFFTDEGEKVLFHQITNNKADVYIEEGQNIDKVNVSIEGTQGKKGEIVKVPVKLEYFSKDIASFQIPITYDETKLKFNKIYFKQGVKDYFVERSSNKIKVVFLSNTTLGLKYEELVNLDKVLFEAEFTILETASGTADVTLTEKVEGISDFQMLFSSQNEELYMYNIVNRQGIISIEENQNIEDVKLSIETVKGTKGNTVKIPVKLEYFSKDIASFQIPITYDTTKLIFNKAYSVKGLKDLHIEQKNNEIRALFLSNSTKGLKYEELVGTDKTLLELEFTILDTASGVANVSLVDKVGTDSVFEMLFHDGLEEKLGYQLITSQGGALIDDVVVPPVNQLGVYIGQNIQGENGNLVKVPVKLNKFSNGIATYQIPVMYDTEKLELLEVIGKENLSMFLSNADKEQGIIKVMFVNSSGEELNYEELTYNNGTLFEVVLKVKEDAQDTAEVKVLGEVGNFKMQFVDEQVQKMNYFIEKGITKILIQDPLSAEVELTLPQNILGQKGQLVKVPVKLNDLSTNIASYQIPVEFDQSKLEIKDVIAKDGVSMFMWNVSEAESLLKVMYVNGSGAGLTYDELTYDNGTLFEIIFQVKETAEGLAEVKITPQTGTFKMQVVNDLIEKVPFFIEKAATSIFVQEDVFKEWQPKLDVDPNKEWTITFNLELDITTITEKNIYVTGEDGKMLSMIYVVNESDGSTKLTLKSVDPYEKGKTYTLWIKNVKSKNGSVLKQYEKMNFTIIK